MLIREVTAKTPTPAEQRVDALTQQLGTARTQLKQQRLQAKQRRLNQQRQAFAQGAARVPA
jgi:hypothetical protein